MNLTVSEYIASQETQFLRLAASTRARLAKQARAFIAENPGCADHSNFWRASRDAKCGLSARQVIAAAVRAQ